MKLNMENIHSKKGDLEKSKEYLPVLLQLEIDYWDWIEFLQKEDLQDVLEEVNQKRHHPPVNLQKELVDWINEHPDFEDLIKR